MQDRQDRTKTVAQKLLQKIRMLPNELCELFKDRATDDLELQWLSLVSLVLLCFPLYFIYLPRNIATLLQRQLSIYVT